MAACGVFCDWGCGAPRGNVFLANVTLELELAHSVLGCVLSDVEDGEIVTITYLGERPARAFRGKGAWYHAYSVEKGTL